MDIYASYLIDNCSKIEEKSIEAFKIYEKLANKGYLHAINSLAYCYDLGLGVVEDKEKAVALYNNASEQEYAPAQSNLGYLYNKGIYFDKNI